LCPFTDLEVLVCPVEPVEEGDGIGSVVGEHKQHHRVVVWERDRLRDQVGDRSARAAQIEHTLLEAAVVVVSILQVTIFDCALKGAEDDLERPHLQDLRLPALVFLEHRHLRCREDWRHLGIVCRLA